MNTLSVLVAFVLAAVAYAAPAPVPEHLCFEADCISVFENGASVPVARSPCHGENCVTVPPCGSDENCILPAIVSSKRTSELAVRPKGVMLVNKRTDRRIYSSGNNMLFTQADGT
ncbi:hypothetical protein BV25DRAFT_1839854 [Artomyces pyxidatus]|uniref:Uncharacterized protein n=1 Tax=Artomyces pyxidatus TaxID=48021 RepID=A0ACB8SVE4_9AGAM|nr:hypothetical protein BV25DRAFT_1839854 [Artomyces pyxidatus]